MDSGGQVFHFSVLTQKSGLVTHAPPLMRTVFKRCWGRCMFPGGRANGFATAVLIRPETSDNKASQMAKIRKHAVRKGFRNYLK